jgi:UbiD family decarboxylase
MKNPVPSEARQAITSALTMHPFLVKHVWAFDDDIDIFNPRDVMWAIATRSQWARDVIILPHTKQTALDPSQANRLRPVKGMGSRRHRRYRLY